MMQENKYYVPEMGEFHIGFEFESKYVLFSPELSWEKCILKSKDASWFFDSYIQDAYGEEFRVKYLDQQDIEELGWEHQYTKDGVDYYYYYTNIGVWQLTHGSHNEVRIIHKGISTESNVQFFRGTIKNKSELKKVMQMSIIQ